MIELLKEARGQLAAMHDHLMELTAKLPMQYFGLVDSGLIQDAGNLIERINAGLAKPAPDAMEIVRLLREGWYSGDSPDDAESVEFIYKLTDSVAAALIESRRVVPRAMLEEIWYKGNKHGYEQGEDELDEDIDAIAAKHGYKVEG